MKMHFHECKFASLKINIIYFAINKKKEKPNIRELFKPNMTNPHHKEGKNKNLNIPNLNRINLK